MITLDDFSFLIVTTASDLSRLKYVYETTRARYLTNEIVIVYDNTESKNLNKEDSNLIEIPTSEKVYVSSGYNIALKNSTKKCFVFIHDDTILANNFLENIVPHVTEKQFCNFTTVEPPIYNDPDSDLKPIKDFGRTVNQFNLQLFNDFVKERISKLQEKTIHNPYGGFFIAGYKKSMLNVGGFDESFKPYFHEDGDLMLRLTLAGYSFIHTYDAMVYHMGSLTSRSTTNTQDIHVMTLKIFIRKWKMTYERAKSCIQEHNMLDYTNLHIKIKPIKCSPQLLDYINLINEDNADMTLEINEDEMTPADYDTLFHLPFCISNDIEIGEYEIGSFKLIKYA